MIVHAAGGPRLLVNGRIDRLQVRAGGIGGQCRRAGLTAPMIKRQRWPHLLVLLTRLGSTSCHILNAFIISAVVQIPVDSGGQDSCPLDSSDLTSIRGTLMRNGKVSSTRTLRLAQAIWWLISII